MEEKYQIIYEFVDGELPAEQESELFAMLATDQEARNELKSILAIKEAVRSDSVAFVPPVKSTQRIFSSLGFSAPGAVATTATISKFAQLGQWLASQYKFIATGIASAVTTALLMWFLVPQNQQIQQIPHNSSKLASSSSYLQDEIKQNNTPLQPELKEKIVYKYIVVEKPKQLLSENIANSSDFLSIITPSKAIPKLQANLVNNIPPNFAVNIMNIPAFNELYADKERNLSLEIKGLSHLSDLKERVGPSQDQNFNNTSFSILYKYSPELSFGIDYTRENFYQKFSGYENNQLYQYEQNPNFETFSLLARYSPNFADFDFARIFAQTSLGGNKVGYVGRFSFGAEIPVLNRYSLAVSYSFSNMYYEHQNKWFSSSKRGVELGAKINF